MITYDEARYRTYIFYGANREQLLSSLEELVLWLATALGGLRLIQRGILKHEGLNITQIRKRALKEGSLLKVFSNHLDLSEELGIFVFDDGFNMSNPPGLLINAHACTNSSIGGISVGGGEVQCFVLIAIQERFITDIDHDVDERIRSFANGLSPLVSREWKNTPYVYDGNAGLEWAYNNLTAELIDGDLGTLRTEPVR